MQSTMIASTLRSMHAKLCTLFYSQTFVLQNMSCLVKQAVTKVLRVELRCRNNSTLHLSDPPLGSHASYFLEVYFFYKHCFVQSQDSFSCCLDPCHCFYDPRFNSSIYISHIPLLVSFCFIFNITPGFIELRLFCLLLIVFQVLPR